MKLGSLLFIGSGLIYLVAAGVTIFLVNSHMRRQALEEAAAKAHIVLDRNIATHTYFTKNLKPNLFELTSPFVSESYFDPTWMSSTYAVREIDEYFMDLTSEEYYFKECAVNARSPENEANEYERAFVEELNRDPELMKRSSIQTLEGKPFLVVLRRGEMMEEVCLRCHSTPDKAPADLVSKYGSARSFGRSLGETSSAVSVRIPLSAAYAKANQFSFRLSAFLLALLAGLFLTQYWLSRRLILQPLAMIRDKALSISGSGEHLGEEIPMSPGAELRELTHAFNIMSNSLRAGRDHLEGQVELRTDELAQANERLREESAARMQAAAEVKASEERYRAIAEDMPVLVCRSLSGGEITYVNDAYCRYFAKTSEELVGTSFLLLIPEGDRERVLASMSALTVETPTQTQEHRVIAPDGSIRWQRWANRAMFDAQGNAVAYQDIGEDITDRKRAEDALIESEAKLRTIAETSADYIMLLDAELKFQYINKVEPSLSIDEVMGKYHPDFLVEKDRARITGLLQETLETGASVRYETEYPLPDGSLLHFESVAAQFNVGESVAGLVVTSRDITDRKLAEDALIESEAKLRTVTDASADYIMLLDGDLTVQYVNRTEPGLSIDEIAGMPLYKLVPEEDQPRVEKLLKEVLETGASMRYETAYLRPDGEIVHFESVATQFNARERVAGLVVTSRDITDRKEAEEALKQSEARYRLLSGSLDREVKKKVAELQQAEKMATIGMVVSSVAHEVRNPLHNIRLGADALRMGAGDDQDTLEILGEINYGVDILNNLIEELLEYSKPLNLQRAHAPLDAIVNQALKMLSHKLDKVAVHSDLDEENAEIFADPLKLGEVLENLISNAADAMPDGGTLKIGSALTRIDDTDFLKISISDTGSGIDEEMLGRIFEPFFTTKAKGTGLGLSVCMRILDAHDGSLNVTSKINKGTNAEILLPLHNA